MTDFALRSSTAAQADLFAAQHGLETIPTGSGPTSAGLGWFNVVDYGADPTGLTDSSAAIQAAYDDLATADINRPGGILYFPDGIFLIDQQLSFQTMLTNAMLIIRGAGSRCSTLFVNTPNGIEAIVAGNCLSVVVEDLFVWRPDGSPSTPSNLLHLAGLNNYIRDVIFQKVIATGSIVWVEGGGLSLRNVYVQGAACASIVHYADGSGFGLDVNGFYYSDVAPLEPSIAFEIGGPHKNSPPSPTRFGMTEDPIVQLNNLLIDEIAYRKISLAAPADRWAKVVVYNAQLNLGDPGVNIDDIKFDGVQELDIQRVMLCLTGRATSTALHLKNIGIARVDNLQNLAAAATGLVNVEASCGPVTFINCVGLSGNPINKTTSFVPLALQEWVDLTLINGWNRYSTNYPVPGVRITRDGRVEFRGLLKDGTNPIFAVLPAAYQPTGGGAGAPMLAFMPTVYNNGVTNAPGYVALDNVGNLSATAIGLSFLALDGLSYFLNQVF